MSFVVKINDMPALLDSWERMLKKSSGSQTFTVNAHVFDALALQEWSTIKWFYYCDDDNGNTLRIYDEKHFETFGNAYYLERDDSQSQGHYERVILRGKNMWSDDEANLKNRQSLRKQFRDNPAWSIFSARKAPIRPGCSPPKQLGFTVLGYPPTVNIEAGMFRERRLWYFLNLNQPPDFIPPRSGICSPTGTPPTTLFERLRLAKERSTNG